MLKIHLIELTNLISENNKFIYFLIDNAKKIPSSGVGGFFVVELAVVVVVSCDCTANIVNKVAKIHSQIADLGNIVLFSRLSST